MKSWRQRVAEARARGKFTPEDVSYAMSWTRCAVGEQHAAMPHAVVYMYDVGTNEIPKDRKLRRLGRNGWSLLEWGDGFAAAVKHSDFDRADQLLDKIEDRALQLKREQA